MTGGRAMALPTALMAPLLVILLIAALRAPWGSVATVDERTYLEMAMGIHDTGLPVVENGPVGRFPALQARWNLYREDRLWGAMAPGFPYLAARLLPHGGVRTVIRVNLALLALLALSIYLAGRELSDSRVAGVAASYIALLSIPFWTSSFGFLPYSLAITGFGWALYLAARAVVRDQVAWSLLAGLVAGFATTSQLLVFPLLIGLIAALAWSRLLLGVAAAVASLPGLMALAWINRIRFGSRNPLSDGPCVWNGCPESGVDPQSVLEMAGPALPLLGWALASALVFWRAGSASRRVRTVVCVILVAPLLAFTALRAALTRYLWMGWRLLIDVGVWGEAENTLAALDGVGTFIGPHVVKALLQASPALVLVGIARLPGRRLALLWFPVAALFSMLLLRANMPVDLALGHPFLNQRYLAPAAPALAILAAIGAARLRWRLHWLALATLVAAILRWTFWLGADDFDRWRRVLLLRGSLLLAVALALTVAVALSRPTPLRRQAATVLAALAFGWGTGVALGVDLPATLRLRNRVESVVSDLDRHLPGRLALVGHPDRLDAALSLKISRDIEYLDLKEISSRSDIAAPIDWWLSDGRPVFALLAVGDAPRSWPPNLQLMPIEAAAGLQRVHPSARR